MLYVASKADKCSQAYKPIATSSFNFVENDFISIDSEIVASKPSPIIRQAKYSSFSMRDGQPHVCPRLQSVSLRWENEGTGYLSMSVNLYFTCLCYYVCSDILSVCYFSNVSVDFYTILAENVTVQAKH